MIDTVPTLQHIQQAKERIAPYIHHTPVLTSRNINGIAGASLYFKCENFQKVGAFKFRGACNAVFSLKQEEARDGVATHSSGNHAQALALAAQIRGIPAYIVMPENAPQVKVNAVRDYGAEITFCAPNLKAREHTLVKIVDRTGANFVHPYNNYRIIAGQATAAAELIREIPDLDYIIAPVGGGGLLSGTALAARYLSDHITVFGAEPQGADDAFRSFQANRIIPSDNPQTIADGLLTSLGNKTFPIIRDHVEQILIADDPEIARAMRLLWERMKIVVEPSAAVPLAAQMKSGIDFSEKKVGVILSGGNVDLEKLSEYLRLADKS